MPTKERMDRVKRVLSNRFIDIRVVLEEVRNPHNASAVARTCDAAGVQYLDVISADNEPFPVNEAVSTRAHKWLEFSTHTSTSACILGLREKGFTVYATYLGEGAIPYSQPDYSGPSAFVFGNEAAGISDEARDLADVCIQIPMLGMTRSLNLSVSVGIILYEVVRQRRGDAEYRGAPLSADEFKRYFSRWVDPEHNKSQQNIKRDKKKGESADSP
ncbi:MAG: RNA methyltransferase [Candidatus Aminicenantes bacterium]|nr:RNA methyltransferase [Candidatus Aminicenantes bacterium]